MKKLLLIAGLSGMVITACKKETFDHQLYIPQAADIDSLYFSTGATSLIADGKASLQFVVEAYRRIEVTTAAGTKKDSMVFVDNKKLPEGALKIMQVNGGETGPSFSATNGAGGAVRFYAQVGELQSDVKTVTLRQPQMLPEKLYVDVVFHVFELNPNDPTFDRLTYQAVSQQHLEAAVADANQVINNQRGNDPNGGSAQVEFRLAAKNPTGVVLDKPGLNQIIYDKSWRASPTFYSPTDFSKKINATASYTWDPNRYLNVYVIPSGANNSMGDNTPKYQIVAQGGMPIPGIPNVVADANAIPKDKNYETYGLGVPRTLFFPGAGRRIELSAFLGTYYGLKSTAVSSPSVTDYCNDTRKYISANQTFNLLKVGIDGIKFLANNAMDDNRYPSLRNAFTLDQVTRMRSVMANAPGRKHGKP